MTTGRLAGGRLSASPNSSPGRPAIFEGTSEIQRMIIGRTVTSLDVR
jgi:hypothetical protein